MRALTARQREVLSYLSDFIDDHKYPPTIREMAAHFGISPKGAHEHLKRLEEKKCIRCDFNRARAIELLDTGEEPAVEPESEPLREALYVSVPVLGRVAAGQPIFAAENLEGYLRISAENLKNGEHFALKISGESMRDAGILDGDMGIFLYRETADNGDIVVAMTEDGSSTVKRFFRETNRVKLKAENPDYADLYVTNIRVMGKLQRIIRNYD